MANRRPIRNKLLLGACVVGFVVATLSASGFVGLYSYRRLVRAVSCRAAELPSANRLEDCVWAIRLAHARDPSDVRDGVFRSHLADASEALAKYLEDLAAGELDDVPFADRSHEQDAAAAIHRELDSLHDLITRPDDVVEPDAAALEAVDHHLDVLAERTAKLPTFLQQKLHLLAGEVRTGYRTLIVTTWASAIAAAVLLAALAVLTYRWVFRPLKLLAHGSRRVASGEFDYRLSLDTHDEMAELAAALNGMTERFQAIRDDLDRQVQLRTREVIRSEQLASVGFLAAGVAHEINNPLASIAMCAESLESRLASVPQSEADAALTNRYLELIQSEAFRCKEITEKLLDFSRLGEVRRQPTAVLAIARDVAEMLRHVGRFSGRSIEIATGLDLLVMVNPQEIKQVVLNLLVNALDCVEPEGKVAVSLSRHGQDAVLEVADDGCGMTAEVLEHLFEPFFTRRKNGQGTGLGLSIVQRIVTDHGGRIEASSDGPGRGATFRVTLPLAEIASGGPTPQARKEKEVDHRNQAA
jgi:two-component system NtrC family sensor kinase